MHPPSTGGAALLSGWAGLRRCGASLHSRPMQKTTRTGPAAALALLATAAPALAADYTVTLFDAPAAGQSIQFFGVNNAGAVAGSLSGPGLSSAFVYSGGTFTPLSGPAGALGAAALGIGNSGVVVGSFYDTTTTDPGTGETVAANTRGFILDGGTYTVVEAPGAAGFTQLRGVSPDGRWVTGYGTDAASISQGFVYDRLTGSFTNLSLPTSRITIPQGVSGSGLVVGSDIVLDGSSLSRPAFTYDLGSSTRTSISLDGYTRFSLRDVDEAGRTVGWLLQAGMPAVGYVGELANPASFTTFAAGSGGGTFIEGNNDAGWLVGSYTVGAVTQAFLATPVPEPTPALMLAAGLAALGWRSRCRQLRR